MNRGYIPLPLSVCMACIGTALLSLYAMEHSDTKIGQHACRTLEGRHTDATSPQGRACACFLCVPDQPDNKYPVPDLCETYV
jgi:hypothetical protein